MDNSAAADPQSDSSVLAATVATIRQRMEILDKTHSELKELKEMLSNELENDPAYQEANKSAKQAQKEKRQKKLHALQMPAAQTTADKIATLKADIAENKSMLDREIVQYYQMSGVNEIEDAHGNVQEFELVAKLKRKK